MRNGALAAIASAAVLLACPKETATRRGDPPARGTAAVTALPKGPGISVQGPPEALRAKLEQAYSLRLDRRFLRAVDELGALAAVGTCETPATASRTGDGWSIEACGEAVGTIPHDPGFPDAMALLSARAERLGIVEPAAVQHVPALPLLTPDDALARLRRVGEGRSRAAVHERAAALATLAFAMIDRMEVADELAARALAAVVLDRALGGVDTAREEALLARALGYEGAAREIARRLPDEDRLRAYLEGEDAVLQKASAKPRSMAVRLLWLRRLAETEPARARIGRLDAASAPLGAALALARVPTFEASAVAGGALDEAVRSVARSRPAVARIEGGLTFHELRKLLHRRGGDEVAFLRTCFFDAIWTRADFALDRRSDPAAAKRLLRRLGDAALGAPEDALRRYLALRIAAAERGRSPGAILEGLETLPELGGLPRVELYEAAAEHLDHGVPARIAGLRSLAATLDGRPAHRRWLASFARSHTSDPRLREETLRSAARVSGDPWARAHVARLDGELETLRALAGDPRLGFPLRSLAVTLLAVEGTTEEEIEQRRRALLSPERDDWTERKALVASLEKRKRYAEAEALVREWLDRDHPDAFQEIGKRKQYGDTEALVRELVARDPPGRGLRGAIARTSLARLLLRQGRREEALAAIEPAASTWHLGAMRQGGIVLAAMGEEARARELGAAAEERYSGAAGAAAHAAVLWRLGDHERAARVLAPLNARIVDWYRTIAQAFMEVLGDDPAQALAAFDALRRAKIGAIELSEIASAAHRAGNDELAFELASRLRDPNPIADLELAVGAYVFLDATKGREAARAWLDQRVPPPLRPPLSMFAFSRARDELLWGLVQPPAGTSEQDDFVWLMFAASSLRVEPTRAHAAALAARFAGERPGFYHRIGRFLLGYEGAEEVIASATAGKRACEASYYLGYKAERNGDIATAADWYRASVENGTPRDGEYRWAMERLGAWSGSHRSLARLAAERAATPPRPAGSPPP